MTGHWENNTYNYYWDSIFCLTHITKIKSDIDQFIILVLGGALSNFNFISISRYDDFL